MGATRRAGGWACTASARSATRGAAAPSARRQPRRSLEEGSMSKSKVLGDFGQMYSACCESSAFQGCIFQTGSFKNWPLISEPGCAAALNSRDAYFKKTAV